jgi:glycerol-3-phosphate O-acyltransferase
MNVKVVPISISYEKVLEAELYSNELMGEQKTKESLQGLIRASKILRLNFGRISVIFNDPLSLKQFGESRGQQLISSGTLHCS